MQGAYNRNCGRTARQHCGNRVITSACSSARLTELLKQGINSPAYEPGPYSALHEDGVIQFVDWYLGRMRAAHLPGTLAAE